MIGFLGFCFLHYVFLVFVIFVLMAVWVSDFCCLQLTGRKIGKNDFV